MTHPDDPGPPRDLRSDDPDYPSSLRRLARPPHRLRVRGTIPSWEGAVAIVGTRRASERGLILARGLARDLAARGCVIVSGGAVGVDHAAHLGALDEGAPTVVVHGSGLGRPYPAAHRSLYERIVRAGGFELSALEDACEPRRYTFLERNRIMAALCRAVIVVEAPLRSGALSTAAAARSLGVPVLATPRVPPTAETEGSNALLRAGALPCLDETDVLAVLRHGAAGRPLAPGSVPRRAPRLPAELGPNARAVAEALAGGPADIEEVAEKTGLSAAPLQAAVAELELLGALAVSPTGQLEMLG